MELEKLKQLLTPKWNKYIPIEPTPKQTAFLLLNCLDAFYGGACAGGKTTALLAAALQYVDIVGYRALLIRDTYANLTMPGSLLDVAENWLASYLVSKDVHWSAEKKTFSFPPDGKLVFGYLDGPKDHFNYLSSNYHFIGADECVGIRQRQLDYLFSRLRKKKGDPIPLRFRCASNPPTSEQIARGAWVKDKYVDLRTRHKDVIFISAKMDDNKYIDKLEYEKSLSKLDPVTRMQLKDGDWEIRESGDMFDRSWFDIVDIAPVETVCVRAWDLAATKKTEKNDPAYTAGVLMSKDQHGIYYIENIIRFRKDPLYVEQMLKQTAYLDGKKIPIRAEQEGGSGGKLTMSYIHRLILPEFDFQGNSVSNTGSKIERAKPFSSQCASGNVKIVRGYWNKDFLEEAELFPFGKFKDQIDACSLAYNILAMQKTGFRSRAI